MRVFGEYGFFLLSLVWFCGEYCREWMKKTINCKIASEARMHVCLCSMNTVHCKNEKKWREKNTNIIVVTKSRTNLSLHVHPMLLVCCIFQEKHFGFIFAKLLSLFRVFAISICTFQAKINNSNNHQTHYMHHYCFSENSALCFHLKKKEWTLLWHMLSHFLAFSEIIPSELLLGTENSNDFGGKRANQVT